MHFFWPAQPKIPKADVSCCLQIWLTWLAHKKLLELWTVCHAHGKRTRNVRTRRITKGAKSTRRRQGFSSSDSRFPRLSWGTQDQQSREHCTQSVMAMAMAMASRIQLAKVQSGPKCAKRFSQPIFQAQAEQQHFKQREKWRSSAKKLSAKN